MRTHRRYALVIFILLAVGLIAFCVYSLIKSEFQRQQLNFAEYVHDTSGMVGNQLDTNDAVLAGFCAFLQAVNQSDTEAAARYAATVSSSYPHIYMLEVARAVPVAEQDAFEALLRRTWHPAFRLKPFPGVTAAAAQAMGLKETWPILFLYPALEQASQIYGVRLETVPHLAHALVRSRDSATPISSPVFEKFEGGQAYILLRSVSRPDQGMQPLLPNFFGSSMVAMLLINTDALLKAAAQDREDIGIGVTAQLKGEDGSQTLVFSLRGSVAGWLDQKLLPLLTQRVDIKSTSQPMTLLFERQLRLTDLLNPATLTTLVILLSGLLLIPLAFVRHFAAIEKAQLEHERSVYLATHDVLTGLPNRYLLADRFQQAVADSASQASLFAVLLVDLDDFKLINDNHGHAVGDQVLQTVAARMSEAFGRHDTVARYGGDEFVVVVADIATPESAATCARKMLQSIELPMPTSAGVLTVSCSVGVTHCPVHGNDLETLIKAADQVMYNVKRAGKGGLATAPSSPTDVGLQPQIM